MGMRVTQPKEVHPTIAYRFYLRGTRGLLGFRFGPNERKKQKNSPNSGIHSHTLISFHMFTQTNTCFTGPIFFLSIFFSFFFLVVCGTFFVFAFRLWASLSPSQPFSPHPSNDLHARPTRPSPAHRLRYQTFPPFSTSIYRNTFISPPSSPSLLTYLSYPNRNTLAHTFIPLPSLASPHPSDRPSNLTPHLVRTIPSFPPSP